MPHVQPRSQPKDSPSDLNGALDAIAGLGVNLMGMSGSNIEFDGEVGFLVENDQDIDGVVGALSARYETRVVGESQGLHLDYVDDETGGLAATVRRARKHHRTGVIRDMAIGVRTWGFTLDGADVVRDNAGDPVPGGDARLPVQIFFIEPYQHDEEGNPITA